MEFEFTGDMSFFHEVEDARQEAFEIFCQEGGNNGEPVLNPDGADADFEAWLEFNGD
jgi:hypothetical protein